MVINSKRLEKLIEEPGLTQKEVSTLIGRSPGCVSVIIHNGRTSKQTVGDLCKVLRVTPDVLTDIPDEKPKEDTQSIMSSIHMLHRKMGDLERQMSEMTEALTELKGVWE